VETEKGRNITSALIGTAYAAAPLTVFYKYAGQSGRQFLRSTLPVAGPPIAAYGYMIGQDIHRKLERHAAHKPPLRGLKRRVLSGAASGASIGTFAAPYFAWRALHVRASGIPAAMYLGTALGAATGGVAAASGYEGFPKRKRRALLATALAIPAAAMGIPAAAKYGGPVIRRKVSTGLEAWYKSPMRETIRSHMKHKLKRMPKIAGEIPAGYHLYGWLGGT